ncbi:DEAD/DEAH box helicase [Candidatus Dependentiae bacterium Noda2021]|nr:DEAD/DEAH box helicase [Candidatus Dependentiae bacterium Noda2021]
MLFKDFPLNPLILKTLDTLGFTEPTEIQEKAIPLLTQTDKIDFLGQAQTGTGKTLAFGIPLVQRIDASTKSLQALIVAPTRELVVQITNSISAVAHPMGISVTSIYGGVSMSEQIKAIKRGTHIVVCTPGRINDHLRRGTLNVNTINTLVLDEADIMLDMGFKEEVDEILTFAPKNREIWLFSATIKAGVHDIMKDHMKNPVTVRTSPKQIGSAKTKQYYTVVSQKDRFAALRRFIDCAESFYGFVFCQTKVQTAEVAEKLSNAGYPSQPLHGDMTQQQRNRVIKQFRDKEFTILIATDVAARGIDVADLTHVVNYSLPIDQESYVHRIGRTGRAGKEGIAISFVSGHEARKVRLLESKFNVKITPLDVPSMGMIQDAYQRKAAEYLAELTQDSAVEYPQDLKQLVSSFDHAALTNAVCNILGQKFFRKATVVDQAFTPASKVDLDAHEDANELVLFIGEDDGVTKSDIVKFVQEFGMIQENELEKVKVIKRRTFIRVDQAQCEPLMNALQGKKLLGQKVKVISAMQLHQSSEGGSKGGRRSGGFGGKRGGDRDRGSFSGRRSSSSRSRKRN